MDARARFTKQAIQDSVVQLVSEEPFHLIRLTEVCQMAQINRSTFYKYYHDLYDWKEQVERDCMAQTTNMLEHLDEVGLQETLSQTLQNVKERKDIFALICSTNFESDVMIDSLDMLLKKTIADPDRSADFSDQAGQSEIWDRCFLIHGLSGVIMWWFKNDMEESPAVLADYCSKFWEVLPVDGT